jgi:hypothetical protein
MSIIDPLAVSNRPLEPGPGRNIPKLARNGAAFQEADGDGHTSAENLGTLLRQVSKPSVDQIDNLVRELQTLRRKLQTDGDRIQRDIAEHGALSQQVMQLTNIISEGVKKLPTASSFN